MMNRRVFAAYMTAKETVETIAEKENTIKVTNAWKNAKELSDLARAWTKNFEGCVPTGMNKRMFASYMSAKEILESIATIGDTLKVTNAYKAANQMTEIASKWTKNFANCDPRWTPSTGSATT